jgi:hypothetical protein
MKPDEFISWLEGLLTAPLPGPDAEEAWFLRSKPFLDAMEAVEVPINEDFFHFVHHYVSDADIRRKDGEYRRVQNEALRKYLAAYKGQVELTKAESSR